MEETRKDYLEPLTETEAERLRERDPTKEPLTAREYEQLMRQRKNQFPESLT